MKGIYILISKLEEPVIKEVGALGKIRFFPGTYAYVGSAQNGIEGRVKRHLKEDKRKHWHIDHLLEKTEVRDVFGYEGDKSKECETASQLKEAYRAVDGFGCSDCSCDSHLFYTNKSLDTVIDSIRDINGEEDMRLRDLKGQ